ncbi:MAG: DNA polymerase II [Chitinivibrionales bacterium]|nr:DNA polymerase II [Chitinivibrionales bacterium]
MIKRCFLLTTSYRDINGRFEITLHAATDDGTPLVAIIDTFRPLFFVPRTLPEDATRTCVERKQLELRAIDGTEVDCLYFTTYGAARDAADGLRRAGIRTYESDVNPVSRYLMERMVRGGFVCEGRIAARNGRYTAHNPRIRGERTEVPLRVLSLDVENNARTAELYSIACSGTREEVFLRGTVAGRPHLQVCPDERSLLQRFIAHVNTEDPDIIIGWNVIDYDLQLLQQRCEANRLAFGIGRGGIARIVDSRRQPGHVNARVPGRVVMDVPSMLRAYNYTFEEYSLDFVAQALLGKHKLIENRGTDKIAEIDRLFAEDPVALARYNLMDTRLTREILDTAAILPNAIERSRRSGHLLDRTGGSVAAFEYLYLPRLHRAGYVALDAADVAEPHAALTGGYVMDPAPGIYENVLVLDFKSLYPTVMMTFLIDPLGLQADDGDRVTTPVGTSFSRRHALLPAIIRELMEARAEAKRTANPYLSQAIKIIMNSFYGVLGAPACRFFEPRLAQTITETGQHLFKLTMNHIEQTTGHKVIYGDTDSLFVLLGPGHESGAAERGGAIAAETTAWLAEHIRDTHDTESFLELEFETHFRHFLIPAVRGGGEGSKKHYCGSVQRDGKTVLLFKGMESVRTDWTELAKGFQHELCLRLFAKEPVEEFILATVKELRAGRLDDKLVYRKRIRKALDQYTTGAPPHVQAARLLDSPARSVKYLITVDGPQPVQKLSAPLDYDHYVDAQLKPIADTLLSFLDLDFDRITSGQQDLFA